MAKGLHIDVKKDFGRKMTQLPIKRNKKTKRLLKFQRELDQKMPSHLFSFGYNF